MKAFFVIVVLLLNYSYSQFDEPSLEDMQAMNMIGQLMGINV